MARLLNCNGGSVNLGRAANRSVMELSGMAVSR